MPAAAPADLSNRAIRVYAERVGKQHNIYDSVGRADIDRLVHELGGTIKFGDRESLIVHGTGEFTILLSRLTYGRRDRFTKAHELGHYFLHYRLPNLRGRQEFDRGRKGTIETQANVFASTLLMPETYFREAFLRLGGDDWKLSKLFEVSPDAAKVRSEVLDLHMDQHFIDA